MYNATIGLKLIHTDIVETPDTPCLFKDVEIDISTFIKRICGRGVRSKRFSFSLIVFLILLMLLTKNHFMNFTNTHKPSSSATLNFTKILGTLSENVPCYLKYIPVCRLKGVLGTNHKTIIAILLWFIL